MTENKLLQLGFKKKTFDDDYWYELSFKDHKFITNDTLRNERKDEWFIGYQNKADNADFWFNEKLNDVGVFKIVFHLFTGIEFKLACQRKLVR